MSYLYVKWNRSGKGCFRRFRPACPTGSWHVSLAPPGTKACDAAGGAFRPEWREGQ